MVSSGVERVDAVGEDAGRAGSSASKLAMIAKNIMIVKTDEARPQKAILRPDFFVIRQNVESTNPMAAGMIPTIMQIKSKPMMPQIKEHKASPLDLFFFI